MKPRSTIYSLQILRAVAAMLVIMHHTIRAFVPPASNLAAKPDTALQILSAIGAPMAVGVDIFFVISGFIMMHISAPYVQREKPLFDFVVLRVIRIYPMYLLATLMLICIQAVSYLHGTGQGNNLDFGRIASSLLMLPYFNEKHLVQPILGVGWTLSYEIFFYLAFVVALLCARRLSIIWTLIVILLFCNLFANIFFNPDIAALVFFSDRIMFEFLFGCAIAVIQQRNMLKHFSPWLIVGLMAIALPVTLFASEGSDYRFCLWGISASLIVLLALRLEGEYLKNFKFMQFMGESSYSLYVFHIIILYYMIVPIITRSTSAAHNVWGLFGAIGLSWCALISIGAGLHVLVEKPIQSALMSRYKGFIVARLFRKDVSIQRA